VKKIGHHKTVNFQRDNPPEWQEFLMISVAIPFSGFLIFYYQSSGFFLFAFMLRSNQIVSKIENFIQFDSILAKPFDLIRKSDSILIRFDGP
jgi:hypothetical protein